VGGALAAKFAQAAVFSLSAVALSSCAYGNRIPRDVILGPLDAVSLAHVGPHSLAVLAGGPKEKTISVFHDSLNSAEVRRFPVSRFSTAVRDAGSGELLLSLAPPKRWGAVELWSISGRLLRTVHIGAPVIGLSSVNNNTVYALTRAERGIYAVPINVRTGESSRPLRVGNETESLDVCVLDRRVFLIAGLHDGHSIDLVDPRSGRVIQSGVVGEHPLCLSHSAIIAVLQSSLFSRNVQMLRLSPVNERASWIVAPPDAVDMSAGDDGSIFLLRITGSDSQIEIWRRQDLAER
jgi:hypothetical protein